jgi:hypothetical protein
MQNEKFTLRQLLLLKSLIDGESLPEGQLKRYPWHQTLVEEGLLMRQKAKNGSRITYKARNGQSLRKYLADNYEGMIDIEARIKIEGKDVSRSEQVKATGNSKNSRHRTAEGFLVNCYEPIHASILGKPFVIEPAEGTCAFINDIDSFCIPEDVIVVGVENMENFFQIRRQKYLFEGMKVLFAARYPQTGDLPKWLEMIPNRYLHFGDFDLFGVSIFLHEFANRLGDRASFFIPDNIEELLQKGSKERYYTQLPGNKNLASSNPYLARLIALIHKYQKGYDQEGVIK